MGFMRPWHWVVIILVLIVVFGAAKLPQIAKSIGQSAKVLKKELKEMQDDVPPELPAGETPPAASEAQTSQTPHVNNSGSEEK